jgi:phosphoribosylanthranilate isomerase
MPQRLVKICGIRHAETARQAALAGADYIGLIFHPESRHCVTIQQAAMISRAAQEYDATPVGVFVDQDARAIEDICKQTDIHIVQLHGRQPRSEHHLLPDTYQRIYVRPVNLQGNIQADDEGGLRYCHSTRDFLLFDSSDGKGVAFNWQHFHYEDNFRWFLAGGLTLQNIGEALQHLDPSGIDISSGVENSAGEKEAALIQLFIQTARQL